MTPSIRANCPFGVLALSAYFLYSMDTIGIEMREPSVGRCLRGPCCHHQPLSEGMKRRLDLVDM